MPAPAALRSSPADVSPARPARPGRLRRRTRRLGGRALVGVILALGAVTPAAASGLGGIGPSNTGAETAPVTSCDSDGLAVSYQIEPVAASGTGVAGAVISGLEPACTGATIQATLSDSTGASLVTGSATVSGPVQTVAFPTPADANLVAGTAVVVTR